MDSAAIDLSELIPKDLPDGREIVADGKALGKKVVIGESLYCKEKGVKSEREWREIAREKRIPCT